MVKLSHIPSSGLVWLIKELDGKTTILCLIVKRN